MQKVAISQGDVIRSSWFREEKRRGPECCIGELIALSTSGVTDVTTETEQYLAPGGQVELDSAKPSPPGQDQVLSLGMRIVETLIPALTLY